MLIVALVEEQLLVGATSFQLAKQRLVTTKGHPSAVTYWGKILQPVAIPYLHDLGPNPIHNNARPPPSQAYHRLPPECGGRGNGLACQQPRPQPC